MAELMFVLFALLLVIAGVVCATVMVFLESIKTMPKAKKLKIPILKIPPADAAGAAVRIPSKPPHQGGVISIDSRRSA